MLKIKLLAVGKMKESYFADMIREYQKRLSRYISLEIIEVPDVSDTFPVEEVLRREAASVQKHIKPDTFLVALCIEGKQMSSEEFSEFVTGLENKNGSIVFLIGGSCGLDPSLKQRANVQLSFSKMTFPHRLMRVILVEQLYRACKIKNGEQYHK